MRYLSFFAFILFLQLIEMAPVCANSINWVGQNGNWNTPSNWDGNTVPGYYDIAVFSNGSTCTVSSDIIVSGISISSGSVTVSDEIDVYVGQDGLSLTGGSFTMGTGTFYIYGNMLVNGGRFYDAYGSVNQVPSEPWEDLQCDFMGLTSTENANFIKTYVFKIPIVDESLLPVTASNVMQQTVYYDGLGRVIQTVAKQGAANQNDLITLQEYDVYGRQLKTYLPYVAAECTGMFRDMDVTHSSNAFIDQRNFYTTNTDPLIGLTANTSTNSRTYMESAFEIVPGGRLLEQAAAGEAWKIQTNGSGHTAKLSYRLNNANEVLLWSYDHSSGNASAWTTQGSGSTVYYPAASLRVVQTKDENGVSSISYTDNTGKKILSKSASDGGIYLETYYIYDYFDQLVYVLPPKLSAALSTYSWQVSYTNTSQSKLMYAYRYDERHRLTEKRIPGANVTSLVYDVLNRTVATQTANQSASTQWSFTRYDELSRSIVTGLVTDNSTRQQLQDRQNTSTLASQLFEYRQTSGTAGYLDNTHYTSNTFPFSIPTTITVLSANYYDNYDIDADGVAELQYVPTGTNDDQLSSVNTGRLVCSKERDLQTMNWLVSANLYDKKGRILQQQKNNQLNAPVITSSSVSFPDRISNVYNFNGQVTMTTQLHNTGVADPITLTKRYLYDHRAVVKRVYQKVIRNTTVYPEILLAAYNYNSLGQLAEKNLHSEDNGQTFLQSVDYRYNIRGWLTSINNSTLTNDNNITNNDANDLYGTELSYETAVTGLSNTPRYNGDITAMRWSTNNTSAPSGLKAYKYTYDTNGRLSNANYAENSGSWAASTKYGENNIGYDQNGNITGLIRTDQAGATIDNLSYTYNGNQLSAMADQGTAAGFTSNSTASSQYSYDVNGNLLTDANRQFTFSYNHLNLITTAQNIGTSMPGTITYDYTASGQKLKKIVSDHTTHYIDQFIYNYDNATNTYTLTSFQTEEGRVAPNTNGVLEYEYDLTDHLGNVRISFDKDPITNTARVIQEDHYYAYGMKHSGASYTFGPQNKFVYTGKELQDDLGLDQYDFGARQYDPVLGRWHCIDPMANYYVKLSPYSFVANNPLIIIDPDGKRLIFADGVSEAFKAQFAEAVVYLNTHGAGGLLAKLEASDQIFYIKEYYKSAYDGDANTIYWNPTGGLETMTGAYLSPSTILNHEVDHAVQEAYNPLQKNLDENTIDAQYGDLEERRVITGSEQETALKLGEITDGQVTRIDHSTGWPYTSQGPSSNEPIDAPATVMPSPTDDSINVNKFININEITIGEEVNNINIGIIDDE